MSWIYSYLIQLYITLVELSKLNCQSTTSGLMTRVNRKCCNGTLGYAGPYPTIPCSEMRCCNTSESVALLRVNHALGFCFRCIPTESFDTKCYSLGQEVATTNETMVVYELRTCCHGLKFKIIAHTNDVAMVITCVKR